MPDWTYAPVLRPALRRLPPGRRREAAVRAMSAVAALPGGTRLIRLMAWSYPVPGASIAVLGRQLSSPVGVAAGLDRVGRSTRALEALGTGFVEVGPVGSLEDLVLPRTDGLLLLRIAPGAVDELVALPAAVDALVVSAPDVPAALLLGVPVLAATDDAASAARAAEAGAAGVVLPASEVGAAPRDVLLVAVSDGDAPRDVLALLDAGADLVALSAQALERQGPGLPQRCTELWAARQLAAPRQEPPRWPAAGWFAGVLIGLALVATGVGAAAISFGPVLLGYDRSFLGGGREVLDVGRLLPFVRHDRITFAGVGLSIGVLYVALAWWGMRRGQTWARATLAVSCAVGMATLLLFLGFGYFDPLHATVTTLLLPLLLVAVLQPLPPPVVVSGAGVAERVRHRALVGQLLLVVVAVGLIGGGVVVSIIGVTGVFVPSDLVFIGTTAQELRDISDRIIPFVAHDRAGFGGALVAQGLAVLGLSAWGIRPGERWVWWSLVLAAVAGYVPTIAVHAEVGYTDLGHLGPVYAAAALTAFALWLTRDFLHLPG